MLIFIFFLFSFFCVLGTVCGHGGALPDVHFPRSRHRAELHQDRVGPHDGPFFLFLFSFIFVSILYSVIQHQDRVRFYVGACFFLNI